MYLPSESSDWITHASVSPSICQVHGVLLPDFFFFFTVRFQNHRILKVQIKAFREMVT